MHWLFAFGILISLLFIFLVSNKSKPPEGPNRFGVTASPVNFTTAVQSFFIGYLDFKGRASRTEFWYAALFYVLLLFILAQLNLPDTVASILLVVTIIPLFAVMARRLHDTNRSGWFQLVTWGMPPIGTIIALLWFNEEPRD
ncbi:hypothetical protein FHS76_004524 [Ochrobactrum daejeonense]|uniref:DUF805 domain-containing protein n=1 Tax=Brucella daejeonensis TaxID=659015 RepID=A0A7W9B258_9HYPH|nr:DUF805 domain-containing protein [Brucella daejeonensis]MBB5704601.1 hypothetical protein [Brucella daejeonensis]